MKCRRYATGEVSGHQVRDVVLLPKDDGVGVSNDVHVEQVGDGPLVHHVPPLGECGSKVGVKGAGVIVGVQGEQIVDVTSDDQLLGGPVHVALSGEDTCVGVALLEAPRLEPRE
eukprot:3838429-Pleurochrysis_carterae.AAC.1